MANCPVLWSSWELVQSMDLKRHNLISSFFDRLWRSQQETASFGNCVRLLHHTIQSRCDEFRKAATPNSTWAPWWRRPKSAPSVWSTVHVGIGRQGSLAKFFRFSVSTRGVLAHPTNHFRYCSSVRYSTTSKSHLPYGGYLVVFDQSYVAAGVVMSAGLRFRRSRACARVRHLDGSGTHDH